MSQITVGFDELDLARLGAQCRAGQDVVFILGLDGTRWAVQATGFTDAWPGCMPPGQYVLVTLAYGAYEGRTYPFKWGDGTIGDSLHAGYVGQKLGITQDRDRNDLTRILAVFLNRPPMYVGKFADLTERAEFDGDRVIVRD